MPLAPPTALGSREYSYPAAAPEPEMPGAVDTLAAAFRQNNVVSSLYDRISTPSVDTRPVAGYSLSVDDVVGYEDFADRLVRSQSPAETQQIKSRITREQQDQATIRAAGKWGLAASVTAGLVDPATLISMAIPGAGVTRAARIGTMIATDAAVDTASEVAMHSLQETRTKTDSFINVGAGALMNGVLGAIATRASKPELTELDKAIRADWDPDSTAGAAAVGSNLTREQLGIARGGETLAKTVGQISPLTRSMLSESKQVRRIVQQLSEVPYITKANDEGIASEHAVETLIKRHEAVKGQVVTASDKFYTDYATRVREAGEKPLSFDDFRNEVGTAMFRKDASEIPEAAANAAYYRSKVIDPYTKQLQEQKLLNDPVKDDQEKLTNRAVDKYVKAQTKQLYGDYRARVNQAIQTADAGKIVKGTSNLEGETLAKGSAGAQVRTELERAIEQERNTSGQTIDQIDQTVSHAESVFDARLVELRKQRELNAQALAAENETRRATATVGSADAKHNLREHLALALSTERQVRAISVEKAEAAYEQAMRANRTERASISRDGEPGKKREALLRSKVALKDARVAREKALGEAASTFEKNRGVLVAKHGKEEVRAAAKHAAQSPSLREAYLYGRDTERARRVLDRERGKAKELRTAERARAREATAELRKLAEKQLEKLSPVKRRQFIKRAQKVLAGEADDSAEVNELARLFRRKDRGELAAVVTVPKTQKTGFETVGATSYRPRLYDVPKIKANLTAFRKVISDHAVRQGVDEVEAKTIANDVQNSILGTTRGQVSLSPEIVVKAGPLKERTLTVPDELLAPFLVNDAEKLMVQYVGTVAPQIEVAKKFGSIDMKEQLQAIDDEFGAMIEAATTDKAKRELTEKLDSARKDILGIRDRLTGQAGAPSDPESWVVRGSRLIRDYNYVRLLGSQLFSSIADAGRVITRHGMTKTATGMTKFLTNMASWKMARADAKRMGIGLDWTLNTRAQSLGDIGDFANTRAEQISQRMTSNFSRVTGMATWNSTMKFLTTALEQDAVLDAAERVAKGQAVSAYKLTKLAQSGLDQDMLKRIAKQAGQHGEFEGLRRARSELWQDEEAQTAFEAAMLKASDIQVLNKGAGDTPLLMSNEMAKTIFQFQGFGMAAVNRLLIPAAQGLARGDLAMLNGLMVMLSLGVARYYAKQVSSDQPIDNSPANLMREAVDGAGLTSYFVQPYDAVASITGMPRFSRFSDRSIAETLSGPSVGTINDLAMAAQGFQDGMSKKDIHRIRKLLPYQNLFYIRRAINALEQETGEAVGASD
jgi:hypothetical protein